MSEQFTLFRDRATEKREAKKMKGTKQVVRVAYGSSEIPEYRERMLTVYEFGLAVTSYPAPSGVVLYGVTHVGTGYAIGPKLDRREQAVELCYLLRDLDWHFDRRDAVTEEHRRRTEESLKDVQEAGAA